MNRKFGPPLTEEATEARPIAIAPNPDERRPQRATINGVSTERLRHFAFGHETPQCPARSDAHQGVAIWRKVGLPEHIHVQHVSHRLTVTGAGLSAMGGKRTFRSAPLDPASVMDWVRELFAGIEEQERRRAVPV